MKGTTIIHIDNLERDLNEVDCRKAIEKPNGSIAWVPSRGVRLCSLRERFKAALLVFTGKADALEWRGQ